MTADVVGRQRGEGVVAAADSAGVVGAILVHGFPAMQLIHAGAAALSARTDDRGQATLRVPVGMHMIVAAKLG